jgi:hypothetical protein
VKRVVLFLALVTGCGAGAKMAESNTPSDAPQQGNASSLGMPGAERNDSKNYNNNNNNNNAGAGQPGQPPAASAAQPAPTGDTDEALNVYRERALASIKAKNCVEACRALTALERTVSRLCTVEPARCFAATELAKRTHANVVESCPSCSAAP